MKQIFVTGTLLAALCGLASAPARAQAPGSGGPTPTTPVSPDPTPVPIDGGASLLASGVAYGLKRLRTQRRRA